MKMSAKTVQVLIISLLLCFNSLACSRPGGPDRAKAKQDLSENEPMIKYFLTENPGRQVIKTARADLNADGRTDMVVIYQVTHEKNMMRVILDLDGRFLATSELPAPVSNQVVQFKDIENKPPMEFIVQGSKDASIGYAIFRVEGTKLVNIFGEGMKECC